MMKLSAQEREAMLLMVDGKRDKEIAETLTLTLRGVQKTLDRARDKLGAETRPQAAVIFVRHA